MPTRQSTQTNRDKLEEAGLIPATYEFPPSDAALIESLTEAEVQSLIDIASKLGSGFLDRHGGGETAGILF